MTRRAIVWIAALGFALPCWGGDDGTIRPPERLSETGLYAGPGTSVVDPRNRPYSPQYPLWTDGAKKARWIRIPDGAKIVATDDGAWEFPVGTKLWKQFSFGVRKAETRMIWKVSEDRWIFAAYVWNDAQDEATLAPAEGIAGAVEIEQGKRHSIPSATDCAACHEGGRTRVLGFSALQLSDDRDPNAVHAEPLRPGMVTNRTLVEEKRLEPDRSDLVALPPRISARSPRERAVLGYLATNCGTCHNPEGPLAGLGLVLSHEPGQGAALSSTIGVTGRYAIPGAAPGSSRWIAPGSPETSSIVYRMRSRRPSSQMPPLGTVLADADADAMIEAWIREDLR